MTGLTILTYFSVIAPVFGLAANVFVHIVSCRSTGAGKSVLPIVQGLIVGLFLCLGITMLVECEMWEDAVNFLALLIVNMSSYVGLSYCYLNFVLIGESSLRIRLFSELDQNPDGLSLEQVNSVFGDDVVLNDRLERYLNSGHIEIHGDRFYLTDEKLFLLSKTIRWLRKLVLGRSEVC